MNKIGKENISYIFSKKMFISNARNNLISIINYNYDVITALEIMNRAYLYADRYVNTRD